MTTYTKTELLELIEKDNELLRNYQQAVTRVDNIPGYEVQQHDLNIKIQHVKERIAEYKAQLNQLEN